MTVAFWIFNLKSRIQITFMVAPTGLAPVKPPSLSRQDVLFSTRSWGHLRKIIIMVVQVGLAPK